MSRIGHNLILKRRQKLENLSGPIIEIGSERDGGSTEALAHLAKALNAGFLSVDIDRETVDMIKKHVEAISWKNAVVCCDGVDFLKEYSGIIRAIYLDAYDWWHPGLEQKVIDKYKERNQSLDREACYQFHLECAKNLCRKVVLGGYVCFDDVYSYEDFEGKGKTAIPWLVSHGYVIDEYDEDNCSLILRRKK